MSKDARLSDIFITYSANIKKFISRFVNADDIDDIVQETFVRSYEADLKKEIKYVRSYMLQTAKHIALNHIAKWDNKYSDSIEDFVEPPVELKTQDLELEFESKERFLQFCQATDSLTGTVKKSFILKKVYGLSQKEIANHLKLSESTVEKHVAKGLLKCSQYMEQINDNHGQNIKNNNMTNNSTNDNSIFTTENKRKQSL